MGNKKKMVFNVLFLVLIFAGTIYGVFHGEDIGQISDILQTVNPWWLIPGVVCVVVFIWGESIIIHYMMRNLGVNVGRGTCFLFSSVGFFFSCITPSASGGQPAQIYYMKKKKIPIPVSTQVLLIVTIMYKLVLVLLGLGIAIFGQSFIHTYIDDVQWVFYLGLVLNVVCVAGMVLYAFHPSLAKAFVVNGSRLLERMNGKVQPDCGLHGRTFRDAGGSVHYNSCAKILTICSYMVCVQGVWTFRIIIMAYHSHAGSHSSCGGYASPSGWYGNQ